jgi:hypothetical protein
LDFFRSLKAQRTTKSEDTEIIEIMRISVCFPAENGTSSKRNFHLPESNCRTALKLGLPRLHSISTTAAAANPSATSIKRIQYGKPAETFQSEFSGVGFFFMPSVGHSVGAALAATASVIVARLVQMPETYWAAIVTLVVMQSSPGATLTLSIERIVAASLGASVGAVERDGWETIARLQNAASLGGLFSFFFAPSSCLTYNLT